MRKSTGNIRKRYVDHLKGRYKPTCLIHGPRHSAYECNILGDFGSKYAKSRPTKYHRKDPATGNKFNRHQQNNFIVNSEVDEILLQENQKLSAYKGAHENIEYDFDENELYQIDNMSIEYTE